MMRTLLLAAAALTCLASLPAQRAEAAFAAAVADYRAGRHQAAFAAFQEQLAAAGEAAPAALRWNLALAALRLQRSGDAELAVQPWLLGDDAALAADAEFVVAMASFQRAERAATAAQLPDAEPMAWTMAVQAMERAAAGFLRAGNKRGAWPEAERNAERARARLLALRQLRDAARAAAAQKQPEPPPLPLPGKPEPSPEEAPLAVTTEPSSAAELAALRRRVEQREREKRALRRSLQVRASAAGERGW